MKIFIAVKQPQGFPEENWLSIPQQDLVLSFQLPIYVPDLEKMKTWTVPEAETIASQ